jgi:hypothetical protein
MVSAGLKLPCVGHTAIDDKEFDHGKGLPMRSDYVGVLVIGHSPAD